MIATDEIWVPSAAFVPQEHGPDFLAPVDGAPWSDGDGFRRGFFSAYRVRAGREMWFHAPLPAPVRRHGEAMACTAISLLWETIDDAAIMWLVLQHGGMERLPLTERLVEPDWQPVPDAIPGKWREYHPASARRLTRIVLDKPLPLLFGLQLSVGIRTGNAEGTIRFYGAGAEFAPA